MGGSAAIYYNYRRRVCSKSRVFVFDSHTILRQCCLFTAAVTDLRWQSSVKIACCTQKISRTENLSTIGVSHSWRKEISAACYTLSSSSYISLCASLASISKTHEMVTTPRTSSPVDIDLKFSPWAWISSSGCSVPNYCCKPRDAPCTDISCALPTPRFATHTLSAWPCCVLPPCMRGTRATQE